MIVLESEASLRREECIGRNLATLEGCPNNKEKYKLIPRYHTRDSTNVYVSACVNCVLEYDLRSIDGALLMHR